MINSEKLEMLKQKQEELQKKLNTFQKGRSNQLICLGTDKDLSELQKVREEILSLEFMVKFKGSSFNRGKPTEKDILEKPSDGWPRTFKPDCLCR